VAVINVHQHYDVLCAKLKLATSICLATNKIQRPAKPQH